MTKTDACTADIQSGPPEAEIQELFDRLGVAEDASLIGVLQETQDAFDYLPPRALEEIGRRMRLPLSKVYGVVSFYAQFHTTPRGRHAIRCCRGTACHVRGAGRLVDAIQRTLGVEDGESTPDLMFHVESVACLGACALAPVVIVDGQYKGKATPSEIEKAIQNIVEAESSAEEVE